MEISKEKLEEFSRLYRLEYGEELTSEETLERGLALIQLVKLAHQGNENENYGTN